MKFILRLFIGLFVITASAQVTNEGQPLSWKLKLDQNISAKKLPTFDLAAVKAEDAIDDGKFEKPWRFGYMHSVDYGLNDGEWTTLDNGDRIWRMQVSSPGALSMNFVFDDFYVPDGGKVYLYSNDQTDLLGAYTSVQNQDSGILGTWLVKGENVWIEYFEPANVAGQGRLHIAKATHGYRNASTYNASKGLNDSGSCNADVDCPIGADWEELKELNKRSAGILLTNGNGFCSGALVNNTSNDGTPYFLTANHCYSNPAAWSFRFGWISPNPSCATNANSTNGPTNMTISGGSLRARNAGSDFCLVEINQPIPTAWDRVWAGWDKSDNFPSFQVGIHHPSGDIMKVCRDDNPATKEVNSGAQTWEIVGGSGGGWEIGVTEPGSSGSPLFDQDGRIIGQLFGGGAACAGTNDNGAFDFYGRFGVSWDAGATSATRLREWLDPNNTNQDILNSFPLLEEFALDAAVSADIPEVDCGETASSPTITLTNFGSNAITSATITWSIDNGAETEINFSGNLAQNESEIFNLGTINFEAGSAHTLDTTLDAVNGSNDENTNNNQASSTLNLDNGFVTSQMHLELLTDDYAEETTWEFRNIDGTVIDSFGPYQQTTDDNTTFTYDFDVEEGECYVFEIFDAANDGICCGFGVGAYTITTDDNTVVVDSGEFDASEATEMSVVEPLSINDQSSLQFSLYPNPADNAFTVDLGAASGLHTYSIINTLGQVVKKGTIQASKTNVEVQGLNSGIYFISINNEATSNSSTLKFVKK